MHAHGMPQEGNEHPCQNHHAIRLPAPPLVIPNRFLALVSFLLAVHDPALGADHSLSTWWARVRSCLSECTSHPMPCPFNPGPALLPLILWRGPCSLLVPFSLDALAAHDRQSERAVMAVAGLTPFLAAPRRLIV
jgi:hypothetical protein